MISESIASIIDRTVVINGDRVSVLNETKLRDNVIDELVHQAVFGDLKDRPVARWLIWEIGQELGIRSSSIHSVYIARGRKVIPNGFTVPAMNFRGMAYDTARALFKAANQANTKAFICELARGEMGYTDQTPAEYVICMIAGAIKEGYTGPLFIQGDHFQPKCSIEPGVPDPGEIDTISKLIKDALDAGFYNIDIDASTLVDLGKPTVAEQQAPNVHYTAEFIDLIRSLEPAGMTVSVGGEIGHIGGKNSTVEDFTTYMNGLVDRGGDQALISKISVATGTSHGGVVNPDGSLAQVQVDFNVLKDITAVAQDEYNIGGTVQHGASTLPENMLHLFPPTGSVEIHLATGFQNMLMDHLEFPKPLLQEMYAWIDRTKQEEREEGQTIEQFHYKLRKKCWGAFKQATWDLSDSTKQALRNALTDKFLLIFKELGVNNQADIIMEHTPVHEIHKEVVDFAVPAPIKEVVGLSD
jgi:fructose/tagatose bisphosphate aldolase